MRFDWKRAVTLVAALGMASPAMARGAAGTGGTGTTSTGTTSTGSTTSSTSGSSTGSSGSAMGVSTGTNTGGGISGGGGGSNSPLGGGATGAGSAGTGAGATASTSPGTTQNNGSETGVTDPGVAPVDPRTLEPAEIGTGATGDNRQGSSSSSRPSARTSGNEIQSPFLVDLTQGSNNNTAMGAGGTGAGASSGSAQVDRKLRDGLEQLHAANQAEIQSGQMAQQSASSSDVKAFGQRMVTDHSQNDQQLMGLAQTMGVDLEGKAYQSKQKDAQKTAKKFEGKTGSAFDQAYIDAMVKDHQSDAKDVKKLADQARKDKESELASFLDQTEQTMQSHLTEAKQLQSSVKSAARSSSSSSGTGSGTGQ